MEAPDKLIQKKSMGTPKTETAPVVDREETTTDIDDTTAITRTI